MGAAAALKLKPPNFGGSLPNGLFTVVLLPPNWNTSDAGCIGVDCC